MNQDLPEQRIAQLGKKNTQLRSEPALLKRRQDRYEEIYQE
jgi:hypothetical protein